MELLLLNAASLGSTKRSKGQIHNFIELEKIREFSCQSFVAATACVLLI